MQIKSPDLRSVADGVGVLASGMCALHCILAPALLVAATTLPASLASDEVFHQMLLWLILPTALLAFGLGCRQHKDRWVLLLGALGLLGITGSASMPHELPGGAGERFVTLASTSLLITAHLRNFRLCRAYRCSHGE